MATIKPITNSQLKRLQTLYSQFERLSWDEQRTTAQRRRERLDWARLNIRREIESFSDLSSREANDLTDILQVAMGQRPSREAAKALGARGKKLPGKSDVLVSATEINAINEIMSRMGWDQQRLEKFLLSPSSPLRGRAQIRTAAEARKVYFALKGIANRSARA
jgi:hypothetical protein